MTDSGPRDEEGPSETDGTIWHGFDWSEVPPSTAVVETVASATDLDPTALDPLYETIDPDALDMLIRSNGSTQPASRLSVSFVFHDHEVSVHRDGVVVVRPDATRAGSA